MPLNDIIDVVLDFLFILFVRAHYFLKNPSNLKAFMSVIQKISSREPKLLCLHDAHKSFCITIMIYDVLFFVLLAHDMNPMLFALITYGKLGDIIPILISHPAHLSFIVESNLTTNVISCQVTTNVVY